MDKIREWLEEPIHYWLTVACCFVTLGLLGNVLR